MKRTIIATILGIAASAAMVTSSQGQGFIFFQNYGSGPSGLISAPVTFNGAAVSGGAGFNADLLFSLNNGSTFTDLGVAVPFFGSFNGDTANFAGLFSDSTSPETIPGYTTGNVEFIVEAFNGSTFANSSVRGQSAVVTLNGLATPANGLPTGDMLSDNTAATTPLAAFTVSAVPEPTTLALAGLAGLASLVAFRRKNA
jgi:hypothetical protein